MQPVPHSRVAPLGPLGPAASAGHAGADTEFLRQVLPGNAVAGRERDALEHYLVRSGPMTLEITSSGFLRCLGLGHGRDQRYNEQNTRRPPSRDGEAVHHALLQASALGRVGVDVTGRNRWDSQGHRAHSGGGSATPGSLSCQAPAPERTPRTTPRTELVELAPPARGSRPSLSLPAALLHDRGTVSVRPPPHDRSPARLRHLAKRPGQTARSCWSTTPRSVPPTWRPARSSRSRPRGLPRRSASRVRGAARSGRRDPRAECRRARHAGRSRQGHEP